MQADKGLPCNSGSNWGPANHTDQQHVVGIRSIIYTKQIVALRSIYPPCRQRLPDQACSNQDEIWGRASSLGQQHEEGRVAGAASGRWAHQAFNVSSTF